MFHEIKLKLDLHSSDMCKAKGTVSPREKHCCFRLFMREPLLFMTETNA